MYLTMQGLRRALRGLRVNRLCLDSSAQDLIEYALVLGLIALAATAAMTSVAQTINQTFIKIGTKLVTYTS